jgi:putative membrane protein
MDLPMPLPPVLNFALYFGTALLAWVATLALYARMTPYPEFRLVREGNLAAAWSLAGTALGLALPLASLVAHAVSLADLATWAVVALLAQAALWWGTRRLLFPDLREAILADRVSVGVLLGALSLGLGMLNAASLTY